MTVRDLITSYANEELGIKICDVDTEKFLIPHIWKTDYSLISINNKGYVCQSFHQYDEKEVDSWEMKDGHIYIYI